MIKVVPELGLTMLDNNLEPITKINISVEKAAFLIAEENSPVLKGNVVIKKMKNINQANRILPIAGETINYEMIVYFDLEILANIKVKSKVNRVSLNISEVRIDNDEYTKYGVLAIPFGEEEGLLINDSNLEVNGNGIALNLEDFNIVLGDINNTYKEGVYLRIKIKMREK